jgi:hypothetical protein
MLFQSNLPKSSSNIVDTKIINEKPGMIPHVNLDKLSFRIDQDVLTLKQKSNVTQNAIVAALKGTINQQIYLKRIHKPEAIAESKADVTTKFDMQTVESQYPKH